MKRLLIALLLAIPLTAQATAQSDQMGQRTLPASGTKLGFASGCNQTGKAYGYVNANRDFWITLSLGSITSGTNWCEDQSCKLVEGIEYDTQAWFTFHMSPTYKIPYQNQNCQTDNPTPGIMTVGDYWNQNSYSRGALCGGPGTECAGAWPGDWCVGFEGFDASEAGVSAIKDWLASGYQEPFTFYAGNFNGCGIQQGDTCTGSDHGCTWFSVLVPVHLGSVHGYLEWYGFYEIVSGSNHPPCCNKECCQLVKPMGPDLPVTSKTWNTLKELYR